MSRFVQIISQFIVVALCVILLLMSSLSTSLTQEKTVQESTSDISIGNLELPSNSNEFELTTEDRKPILESLNRFNGGFYKNLRLSDGSSYLLSSMRSSVLFTENEIHFLFLHDSDTEPRSPFTKKPMDEPVESHNFLTLEFLGSNSIAPVVEDPSSAVLNQFFGQNRDNWKTGISFYQKLIYYNLYDGIDLEYLVMDGELKYNFYVHPGANYQDIKLHWRGDIELMKENQEMKIKINEDVDNKYLSDGVPVIYEKNEGGNQVDGEYTIFDERTYGFKISEYNRNNLLVIDPLISFSTYISGFSIDQGNSIVKDEVGHVYVTGSCDSLDYPDTTAGNYNLNPGEGVGAVCISKLTSDGSSLIFSTLIGGSFYDEGVVLKLDSESNIYVTGRTYSTDFPVTSGAYDNTYNNDEDIFLLKLAANGSTLLYSTFIGGSSMDSVRSFFVGNDNSIYLTGETRSTDFPTTMDAINGSNNGQSDIFLARMSQDGSNLTYSTYFGGSGFDGAYSITSDIDGYIYITGGSSSLSNVPTTQNGYNETGNGAIDIILIKLSPDLDSIIMSTFIGGSQDEVGFGLYIDKQSNIYIAGITLSSDFPTTPESYDTTYNGDIDAVVLKISNDGSILHYSTFVGGTGQDYVYSMAVDNDNHVYISGHTYDSTIDYPTTQGAYDETHNGLSDIFVSKLSVNGSSLLYSTLIGGVDDETGFDIFVDDSRNVYVTGITGSSDFPITPGAYNSNYLGNGDLFALKLPIVTIPHAPSNLQSQVYDNGGNPAVLLIWDTSFDGNMPIDYYQVYRKSTGNNFSLLGTTNTASNYYNDTTINSGLSYTYVIVAVNEQGRGEYSEALQVNTSSQGSEPSHPLSPVATSGNRYIVISWEDPADDGMYPVTEYRIYRGESSGNYDLVFVSFSNQFNDTIVDRETTYYYAITAINSIGESDISIEVSSTPQFPPEDIETVTQTIINNQSTTVTEVIGTTISETSTTTVSGSRQTITSTTSSAGFNLQIGLLCLLIFYPYLKRRGYNKNKFDR